MQVCLRNSSSQVSSNPGFPSPLFSSPLHIPLPIIIISRERGRELSLIEIMQPTRPRGRESYWGNGEGGREPYFSGRPYFT